MENAFCFALTDGSTVVRTTEVPVNAKNESEKVYYLLYQQLIYISTFQIRLCSCAETVHCIADSQRQMTSCRLSCKSHLEYYGSQTDQYVGCFPKNHHVSEALGSCFKSQNADFCATDPSRLLYISKPNYTEMAVTASTNGTISLDVESLFQVTIVEAAQKFFGCTDACLKDQYLSCLDRKPCGVQVLPGFDMGNPMKYCAEYKESIYQSSMKAAPCISLQRLLLNFYDYYLIYLFIVFILFLLIVYKLLL